MRTLRILHGAAEAYPFVKTGGLGDVIGSLPQALKRVGAGEVAVILPLYSQISGEQTSAMEPVSEFMVPLAWRRQYCGLKRLRHQNVTVYFLDNEYYFNRDGIYGFFDDGERYAFFCRAILESLPYLDFKPDIIHCHDWHTGLTSVFLKAFYQQSPLYNKIKTVFTVHNLKYQGVFTPFVLGDILGLDASYLSEDRLGFYGQISFLKGGLVFADLLATVSKTYAQEIKTPDFGENLHDILNIRAKDLYGILNGLDYDLYNPKTDSALYVRYCSPMKGKIENKVKLQEELGLPIDGRLPLLAIVARLVSQKGLDLLPPIVDEYINLNAQLVVLGTGEKRYEEFFRNVSDKYPKKVALKLTFNEHLARRIYAGADVFLMPSQFEPCGLGQMIALRYGAIPVVRETGGLKDTVIPFSQDSGMGNGFTFKHYQGHDFLEAIKTALSVYEQKDAWYRLVQNAMKSDYGWERSAADYLKLYQSLNKQNYC